MMPRSSNGVLANNEIIARKSSSKTFYRNKYGDSITYTYYGMGVVNGRYFNQCTAVAQTNDQVKVLKSFEAARNFINKNRGEETIFGEA